MEVSFDPAKREKTLRERGVDFLDAVEVFGGHTYDWMDQRLDYGEDRFVCVGWLRTRMVIVVWTPRSEVRRIISMRKANGREQTFYGKFLRRP